MTDVTLSKYAYMWNSDGGLREHPTGYQVRGLPQDHEAFINNAGAPHRNDWTVLPIVNGESGARFGHFESADAALAALQSDINDRKH